MSWQTRERERDIRKNSQRPGGGGKRLTDRLKGGPQKAEARNE